MTLAAIHVAIQNNQIKENQTTKETKKTLDPLILQHWLNTMEILQKSPHEKVYIATIDGLQELTISHVLEKLR